jgi:hypothetical protein
VFGLFDKLASPPGVEIHLGADGLLYAIAQDSGLEESLGGLLKCD